MDMMPTFRRLSDEQADAFLPIYKHRMIRVFAIIILLTVCVRWIAS